MSAVLMDRPAVRSATPRDPMAAEPARTAPARAPRQLGTRGPASRSDATGPDRARPDAGRVAAARGAVRGVGADRRGRAWTASGARACAEVRSVTSVARPAAAPSASGRLYWTPRGVAVMVMLVAVVVGVMATTLVGAFLAVSNEPVAETALTAAFVAPQPGR